jgi:hypothetical protein
MEQVLDRILNPAIAWILIPLVALIFWGLGNIIRALRGVPVDMEEVQADLHDLRKRVEQLERGRGASEQDKVTVSRAP